MPIRGVLLDIDDTLVDTRGAFGAALAAVAEVYLPEGVDVERVVAMWRADASGHYRRHTRGELTAGQQRLARAQEVHAAFGGPPLDEATFPAWDEVFRTGFRDGWRAHADALPTVRALREAGYAVGALTNAVGDLSADKLERVGLAEDVPLLVTLDTLGFGKPDPRVFQEACVRLGTEPGRPPTWAMNSTSTPSRRCARAWGSGCGWTGPAPGAAGPTWRTPPRPRSTARR